MWGGGRGEEEHSFHFFFFFFRTFLGEELDSIRFLEDIAKGGRRWDFRNIASDGKLRVYWMQFDFFLFYFSGWQ